MKTLVIISHPDIINSASQQFLMHVTPKPDDVTVHHLEAAYPDGKMNVSHEQDLMRGHDRIIFQFPLYWYSAPPMLKHWQDEVLTDGFAIGKNGTALDGKEFALVVVVGLPEREYQAGGAEQFSLSELMRPYQAMAHKTGMTYIKPMPIFQFDYLTDSGKLDLVIRYQQMLTAEKNPTLAAKEKWFLDRLAKTDRKTLAPEDVTVLEHAMERIQANRETMDELKRVLEDMD